MEVRDLLEACLAAAVAELPASDAHRVAFRSCRDSLSAELASLLQDAVKMKWPFVPEKWQYKQSVTPNDKTNLNELVSDHLPQLLALLKASILAHEAPSALAVVFLVDRFLYWTDQSSQLLRIARLLHRRHKNTPVAPQVVIRQARVYLNSGKLQKAEYILSSLINNYGTTGCWIYQSDSDRVLVQAVCVQIRGMVLQKLGLWGEAAKLMWASLVGFYALPQPDKKGIGTSLGLLANILVSMNDEEFRTLRADPDFDLQNILGDWSHRLLFAAQAAKMAVIFSQYASLYVLTNATAQGTCLLSYSFSLDCPDDQRRFYLKTAQEAFAIGLLTRAEGELVTSQQELHTFVKAAHSIAITYKWLGGPEEAVTGASRACQEALAHFYHYCEPNGDNKGALCASIMQLVARVKLLLGVVPYPNSEKGSFIPDRYRDIKGSTVSFTPEDFDKILHGFKKYHASVSETAAPGGREMPGQAHELCLTGIGTTIGTLGTDSGAEPSIASGSPMNQKPNGHAANGSSDNSSWQIVSMSGSNGSNKGSIGSGRVDQNCYTTQTQEDLLDMSLQDRDESAEKQDPTSTQAVSGTSCPKPAIVAAFEQAETESSEDGAISFEGPGIKRSAPIDATGLSLSRLALKTSSSSSSGSFGSSWEKILGSSRTSKSSHSNESFFVMETTESDPEVRDSPSSNGVRAPPEPKPIRNHSALSNMVTETDPIEYPVPSGSPYSFVQPVAGQYAVTETSSECSFEMLEANETGQREAAAPLTPGCYSCLKAPTMSAGQSLSNEDYRAFLAGLCHNCLLKRLQSEQRKFKLKELQKAHSALLLKFSKAVGLWTAKETCVYIGKPMEMTGSQRTAIWVQFLHQEERLSSYVGKDYLKPTEIQSHLTDVERQMTAQHYVTLFNKKLYEKNDMAQIFYIPSDALLILDGDDIMGCITVEPYMLGKFVKLTNNARKMVHGFKATEYGIAFGHFTYLLSARQEVVVDLQGWVTANGKGLTYLTDPQIHSTTTRRGRADFADRGIGYFLEDQHGPTCNKICQLLQLPPLDTKTPDL